MNTDRELLDVPNHNKNMPHNSLNNNSPIGFIKEASSSTPYTIKVGMFWPGCTADESQLMDDMYYPNDIILTTAPDTTAEQQLKDEYNNGIQTKLLQI